MLGMKQAKMAKTLGMKQAKMAKTLTMTVGAKPRTAFFLFFASCVVLLFVCVYIYISIFDCFNFQSVSF